VALQNVHVAGAPGAEAEIIPDQQIPHGCAPDEDALDEILRADLSETIVEAHHVRGVDPVARQKLQLFPQRREPCRRLVGREEFPRVGLERHCARDESARARSILQTGEHDLVSDVNTVEIADRQR
jgi:hypothetical protein